MPLVLGAVFHVLGVGSNILDTPTAAEHERTGPFRTAEDIYAAL